MKKLVTILVIMGLLAAGMLVLYSGRASAATTRHGGYADQIVWTTESDPAIATGKLDQGTLNMWLYYYTTQSQLSAAQADSNLALITVPGSINDMLFDPSPWTHAPGQFNPFSVTGVRTAMNYLFDRSYITREIFGGAAFPQTAWVNSQSPEYARDPAFFVALEQQYAYNLARAQTMVQESLAGIPGVSFSNGQWMYQGSQITIQNIVRQEDQRTQIGHYVTAQLRALGFGVTESVVSGGTAFGLVYFGDPTNGAWNVYTEGFAATATVAWDDVDPYYYYCGGNGEPFFSVNGGLYTPPAALNDACNKLLAGQYTSVATREQLIETATTLGVQEGVRIFLDAGASFPYAKNTIAPPVYDLTAGPWSFYTTRSAQLLDSSGNPTEGGTLTIGNRLNFVSDWNPWAPSGFSFLYDILPFYDFADYGVFPDPHTGLYIPIRANFTVNTVGPDGTMDVPSTAWAFDASYNSTASAYNNKWVQVGSGVTAKSEVVFDYTFGPWHDGAQMNMNDILYALSLVFRRVASTYSAWAGGDIYAKDPQAAGFTAQLFAQVFRGLEVLDSTHLAIYMNYWHVDPSTIASVADVWPSTSWDESELAMQTVLHNNTKLDSSTAQTFGLTALDLSKGETVSFMNAELASANVTKATVPPGFGSGSPFPVSAANATTRWTDLWNFYNTTGTFYSSNGPYMISRIDTSAGQIVLSNFAGYPYLADHWSSFVVPEIPSASMTGPSQVIGGLPATFNLTTTFEGAPYDKVTASYLVLNPSTSTVVLSGDATHTGLGTWAIQLNGAQTTSLGRGAYSIEAITVGEAAAVPVFTVSSFTAIPQLDIVLLQVGLATGRLNNSIAQLSGLLNSTTAQLTSAQNTINSLSTLLYVAIALAVVSLIVAALAIAMRRPRKEGGRKEEPPESMEEPPAGPGQP